MAESAPRREPQATLAAHGTRTTPVAVSPHHLASQAALDVMHAGGNAVDGAIAANAVLGVVLPDTCGIGGDLFAIVHRDGDPSPVALNASGRAGSGTTAADLRDDGYDEIPLRSPWSVTVPGCVDGWEALNERFGAVDLAAVLAPAIELAEGGFPVSAELAEDLGRIHRLIGSQASSVPLYPHGAPPRPGDRIRRSRLAMTLRAIGDGGRAAFYDGMVGEQITLATEGNISPADLEVRQAEWVEPVGAEAFGLEGWTIPPNSQGYLTLATAMLFEALDPPSDPSDPEYVHLLVESYRAVAWERDDLVADPGTAPVDPGRLLDRDRLLTRLASIDRRSLATWPEPRPVPGGTAYFCTRDQDGRSVSIIQSNFHGIGSGLSAGDTGVFLHNRGAGFTLREGHPNELTPGRRPLHTLSPTLWTSGNQGVLVLGTRGGQYQPQILAQLGAALLHGGREAVAAQEMPRWLVDGWAAGDTPRLRVEDRFGEAALRELETIGHDVVPSAGWEAGWGPVSIIDLRNDRMAAAADPRVGTSAAVS